MNRRPSQSAFTLLELVFVLVIICTVLALAAPSLRGWSRGSKLRDAAGQFIAVTQWARVHAISSGSMLRLTIDPAAGGYQLTAQEGDSFVNLSVEFGRSFTAPEGFRLELAPEAAPGGVNFQPPQGMRIAMASDPSRPSIDFYPNGRIQPCRVRIANEDGDAIDIECPSLAEGFRVIAQGDNR